MGHPTKLRNQWQYLYYLLGIVLTITLLSCNPLGVDSGMGKSQDNNNNSSTNRLPVISRVIPAIGDIVGGASLSIRGAYFENGSRVYIGGAECLDAEFVAASEIKCVSPANTGVGYVDVKIENPNGDEYTLTDGYEYVVTTLAITGPNGGVDFTTTEPEQMIHGTCTKNITDLLSNIGTFVDSDCSDGTWSLETYSLALGVNSFVISGTTPDGEATSGDIMNITYVGGGLGLIQIDGPNGGVNFSTNVQTQTIYGVCSTDIVSLSSTLGTFLDSDCADGTWELDPFMMSFGANNFVISGLDGNGNPVSDSISIYYDNVAPAFAITAPHSGTDFITSNISQTVSGTCGTDVVNITTSLGGVSDNNCADGTWSLAPYALSPGVNTFSVTAYDAAGNQSNAVIVITYDNGNYSLAITAPNNGVNFSTNAATQTVSGTCTAGLTGLSSTLGTFADDDCSDGFWSLHPYNLSGGLNTFTISGLTPAGNSVSDTIEITYDVAAPSVAITAPNSGSNFTTATQVQNISGTCSTDVVNITTSNGYFADSDCVDGTWSLTPSVLNSGTNTFTITAYDNAGNHSDASITIIYDDVPAVLQITAPNGGSNFTTNVQSQTVSGICTIDVTNLTTNVGSFADSNCSDGTWSLNAASLNPGDNTFTIEGDDNLGNHLTTTMVINYDAVPPTLSITSPNAGLDFTTNVLVQTVSGSCGTDVVSMTTSLGSFADSNCSDGTWSLNAKVLSPGVNTFTIMAFDAAGNASTASISITYDDVPAQLNITAPNGGTSFVTNSQLQSILGTCTPDVSALATTVGTFADNDCADGTWSLAPYSLSNGLNSIEISGHDNMSNPLSSSINITYDPFAPSVSITLPSNSGSYTTHSIIETVSGTCSSDVVSMSSSNGAFEHIDCATTGTWSLYPFVLTQGDNLFDIVAFDNAGNFSNSTLTITYNYVPSSLRITGPNNGSNFVTNVQSQLVHGTCSEDMTNLGTTLGSVDTSTCATTGEWSLAAYNLASGDNTFTISGLDYLGNMLTDSITITYDTSAPAIAITAPNGGVDFATGQQVQTISGTCSADVTSITTNNSVLVNSDCANTGTWSSGSYVLAAGVNTFIATAHTLAGNTSSATITVTYNYSPSSLQITAPNNGLSFTTNVLSQTISGTCSTDMVDLSTTLGTFADSDCSNGTWSLTAYDLTIGDNTFTISGKDYLGNTLTRTLTITYDDAVPSVSITGPNGGASFTTSQIAQTVSGTCSSDVVSITTSKGAVFSADCAGTGVWQLFPYVLSVGANTFNVTATTTAGTSSNASITITYDNNTYSLHVTGPNGGTNLVTNVQSQTVHGTCTAGITGLTSTLGTFADSNCADGTWSLNPYSLASGVNTFTITGTDPTAASVSSTITINYDTIPPTVTILNPNSGLDLSTYTLLQTINGSCSSDVVSLQTTNGSFADNNCSDGTWALNDAIMNTGLNTFTITGTDEAGNIDIKTINITYYPTPAYIHVTSPASTLYTNTQVHTISGTCSTEVTDLSTNIGAFTDLNCSDGTWSLNTASLNPGLNTLTVSGKDAINNTVSASFDIYYDIISPTLSITAPNAGADYTTNVLVQNISGICGADVTSMTTSLGTFADTNCLDGTWSLNPAVMAVGVNTFTINAYDAAGNFTIATINITFDDTPPTAPSVSVASPTTNTQPTWSWVAGGGGNGTFRYKLDDSNISVGSTETTSLSYTPVAPIAAGPHTLFIQERDEAGNWSTTASATVTIDTCTELYTWGRNLSGQLGIDASLPFVFAPTTVPGLTNVASVSAGGGSAAVGFTLVRKNDGTVWGWGNNDTGQLGIGTIGTSGTPQKVIGLSDVADIQASSSHAVALDNSGNVWSWGINATTAGQLGDGTTTARYVPARVGGIALSLPALTGITKIKSTNTSHALAIASDHTLWAWGLNTSGELGDGTAALRLVPVQVAGTVSKALTVASVSQTTTTVTVTTTGNHNLQTGNRVTMTGWNMPTVNGTFTVVYASLTTFTYTAATATGTATGGTATVDMPSATMLVAATNGAPTITGNGSLITVTTAVLHGMAVGQKFQVVMSGWSGGSGNWNGTYEATATTTSAFTYVDTGTGSATNGKAILNGGSGAFSDVIDIATGTSHSVALKSDGTVWAWGLGTSGQIGNNASLTSYIPVQVQVSGGAPLTDVTSIAAGTNFSIARKSDGTVWAWGLGTGGQLGDGTIVTKNYAVQVKSGGVGMTDVSNNISAGGLHSLVVKDDGTVWAWGANTSFQTGDGVSTTTARNQAVQVSGITNAVQVNAGFDFSLATLSDGTVKAWGASTYSQLGVQEINRTAPTPIYGFEDASIIDASSGITNHVLLKSDGTVWTSGSNASGQLGLYLPTSSVSGNGTLVTVTTTSPHGLYSGQSVVMAGWTPSGYNATANIIVTGPNTFTYPNATSAAVTVVGTLQPTLLGNFEQVRGVNNVGYLTDVTKVRAGTSHMLALKTDGTVYGWGLGTSGQLGDTYSASRPVPMLPVAGVVSKELTIASVSQTTTTVTVTTVGNHDLETGNRVTMTGWNMPTVNGTYVITYASLTTFTYTTTTASGTATGGTAVVEQPSLPLLINSVTGNGTTTTVTTTLAHGIAAGQKVIVAMSGWTGGSGTWDGTFEITRTGTATFTYPSTGNGTATGGTAILNGGSGAFIAAGIRAGGTHSVALKSDGTVWAWGIGTNGQIGSNSVFSTSFPSQVLTTAGVPLTDVTLVSTNANHNLALKSDGTVWAWGINTNGQLGDGSATQRNGAVQVLNLTDVVDISAGVSHSLAVKSDGTVWAWGLNTSYQLGDGTILQRNQPVQVLGIGNVSKVLAGGSIHSFAVKDDGTVWAWGALYNNYGYLGDGTTGYLRMFPTQVQGLSRVSVLNAGDISTVAIQNCSY